MCALKLCADNELIACDRDRSQAHRGDNTDSEIYGNVFRHEHVLENDERRAGPDRPTAPVVRTFGDTRRIARCFSFGVAAATYDEKKQRARDRPARVATLQNLGGFTGRDITVNISFFPGVAAHKIRPFGERRPSDWAQPTLRFALLFLWH